MHQRLFLYCVLLFALSGSSTGCAALIDAAFREGQDHGDRARYENKDYHEHFFDALLEDDDDDGDCRRRTTIVVEHG